MTVKASSIKGLAVFALDVGKNIQKAKEVIYNPDAKKIEAILINKSGMVSEAKAILIKDIKSIGKDAIIVESNQVIKNESELSPIITELIKAKKSLPKSKVMTDDGVNMGKVSDLLFEPSSGQVEEFEVSQGPIKDLETGRKTIKVSDIVSMNEETMVVKSSVKSEVEKQSKEKGIEGTITKLSSDVKQKVQTIKEKTNQQPQSPPPAPPTPKTESPIQDLKAEGIEVRDKQNQGRLKGTIKPSEK